ncbi:MAG: tellurite resistance TerB family protein [Microcoleaceae cyanobacterium]
MGLFDQTATTPPLEITLTPGQAFASICLIAVAADGVITGNESQAITTIFSRMNLFSDISGNNMRDMIDMLLNIIKEGNTKALFDLAVKTLPNGLKETVFAVATDLVLADGELSEEEETLLDELYNALAIPETLADKIIDVMLIKNKG